MGHNCMTQAYSVIFARYNINKMLRCQVSSKSVQRFSLPKGSKSALFLCLALWLIEQVRATAQPVIYKLLSYS